MRLRCSSLQTSQWPYQQKERVMTKTKHRVANNTLDRIPKLPMLDLRLHFAAMCYHIPCWPFNWSWNGLCFFPYSFFFYYSHSSRHLSRQNSRDSHASVCNDETCSHGKNVDATVWLGFPVVLIMSLIVCEQHWRTAFSSAEAWCRFTSHSCFILFSAFFFFVSVYPPHPFTHPTS